MIVNLLIVAIALFIIIIAIQIFICYKIKTEDKPDSDCEEFKADDDEIRSKSLLYGLPNCVVNTLYSTKKYTDNSKIKVNGFATNPEDVVTVIPSTIEEYYTKKEYELMLYGAYILYHNQPLLGRRLPYNTNDPRVIEINKVLMKNNICIQYHPKYGMIYCDYIPNPDWEHIKNSN